MPQALISFCSSSWGVGKVGCLSHFPYLCFVWVFVYSILCVPLKPNCCLFGRVLELVSPLGGCVLFFGSLWLGFSQEGIGYVCDFLERGCCSSGVLQLAMPYLEVCTSHQFIIPVSTSALQRFSLWQRESVLQDLLRDVRNCAISTLGQKRMCSGRGAGRT